MFTRLSVASLCVSLLGVVLSQEVAQADSLTLPPQPLAPNTFCSNYIKDSLQKKGARNISYACSGVQPLYGHADLIVKENDDGSKESTIEVYCRAFGETAEKLIGTLHVGQGVYQCYDLSYSAVASKVTSTITLYYFPAGSSKPVFYNK